MSGQSRKDPFHVSSERVRDNLTVTRRVRVKTNQSIFANRMYATVNFSNPTGAEFGIVDMPYAGRIAITVEGGGAGSPPDTIVVNNPYVTAGYYVNVYQRPSSNITAAVSGPGQVTISGIDTDGVIGLQVGRPNNTRRNGQFAR